jgi:benzoyl-CoA 2,3-dioxygenase component B
MSSITTARRSPTTSTCRRPHAAARAGEWQPSFLKWWKDMGPDGSQNFDVYLRTAVSVDPQGWAHFDYVKMPDYRWGIFLNPARPTARSASATTRASPPGRRCPASTATTCAASSSRRATPSPPRSSSSACSGLTCPSLYDLRNLFQVNVEEGRHLWAMVYLLHKYFGRDGREEAEALLERRSGDADKPRILGAFNEPTPDWLSSSCSRTSPTATASTSSARWPRAASTRWRAPPSSC